MLTVIVTSTSFFDFSFLKLEFLVLRIIRRAIGAKPFDIISQIMSESLLLTSLAGLIGLSVGVFLLDVVNNAMASGGDVSNDTFFSNPEIHIGTAVAATVILLFSGLLAGLIPAWRAMQIKAIDAIREE